MNSQVVGEKQLKKNLKNSGLIEELWMTRHNEGCALVAPGDPWPLTFAPWWLKNVRFFIEIICWAPWILHHFVLSTRLTSMFLRAHPWQCLFHWANQGTLYLMQAGQLNRVCTGHWQPGKSWNLRISFFRPGKSWNLIVGPGKSWKLRLCEIINIRLY